MIKGTKKHWQCTKRIRGYCKPLPPNIIVETDAEGITRFYQPDGTPIPRYQIDVSHIDFCKNLTKPHVELDLYE